MRNLRILITNNTLAHRCGSELYVRDIAVALLRLGHRPIAYSRTLGSVANDLRLATVPVVDDLSQIGEAPDVVHGHHNFETMTALLHFRATPVVFVCHGSLPWEEAPPPSPRIVRYVAVDEACRDRLCFQHGITPDRIDLILNFVDLERFRPRPPLPKRPRRALIFSNHASDGTTVPVIRAACEAESIDVDVAGSGCGRILDRPEDVLGAYDLIFARARAALEAMAVGAAVITCDFAGLGGMVTADRFDEWRRQNFGLRCLRRPLEADAIRSEIRAYDPSEAAAVSQRARSEAGLDAAIDRIVKVYAQAIEEWRAAPVLDPAAESAAAAAYLEQLEPRVKSHDHAVSKLLAELSTERYAHTANSAELAGVLHAWNLERTIRKAVESKWEAAERERTALRAEIDSVREEIDTIRQLRTHRLRGWLLQWPRLVSIYQSLSGRSPARPTG